MLNRIFSQEIPSDVTVIAAGTSFSLHKFPLVSKSGYIRQLVSESMDAELPAIEIPDIPGGADGFEFAAKFCYGINFEISTANIATLRCVAEFLEMTEDYAVGNLVGRTEAYVNEVALTSLAGAVYILHSCETLLPIAEEVKLVSRCIDTIAFATCKDCHFAEKFRAENDVDGPKPVLDWWAEDLVVLRIDLFQRVLVAMMARGFKKLALGPILMLYVQKSLRDLEIYSKDRKNLDKRQEQEKRVVLEAIVGLLPREKDAVPVSFISMLLRAAIYLETTVACRFDLEKRMASQLGKAVIDDLLIPSYYIAGDTLFDIETVQRIMMNFFCRVEEENREGCIEDQDYTSPLSHEKEMVARLMESYLQEIACDRNLSVTKFVTLSELVPGQTRITDDGMYRAIDIYLKAHPSLSDVERKRICSSMDCRKLSSEACAHAAKNDRLPVQTVVQVLYHEQQRLRLVMDGSTNSFSADVPDDSSISNLQMENQRLKLELAKMKMRLKDMEKSSAALPIPASPLAVSRTTSTAEKTPEPRKSFMSSVSRKLGRFIRADIGNMHSPKIRTKSHRDRRHSIS
ncbi:BTB/POZ domain-containing protein-like [Dorcoceras hygrometricum]|uniref:BTB/POZ domain-containing protein-like n=1 Tax=Dorcoceras hygrometricum TaxID=472368 RepID=A0A2Z7DCU7_9LAMI|nr:BTB/POZ domain-containing protein-like [Dorcoceras hygrometricum]